MYIRKAEISDLTKIMKIYRTAQDFMIESGNPNQWGHFYPKRDLIKEDIIKGNCYLVCDDAGPHGVFALLNGNEPTYEYIENGNWLNDDEYVTIHRIASDGTAHGIFRCAINYCKNVSNNIRIDTHKNNLIMQSLIEKNGFCRCGRIYVADESPRIAYHWSQE
jgi:hypothetical protein